MVIHTIGNSTRGLDEFVEILVAHGIAAVADVRRFPASRRHPYFGREALAGALSRHGIGYEWIEALGGRRAVRPDSPHTAWTNDSFRGFADHMDTAEFARGLDRLVALARTGATAVLCAEAVPWRCHRQLVADALLARGIEVRHVLGAGPARAHRLTGFARVDGTRVLYDKGQLELGASRR